MKKHNFSKRLTELRKEKKVSQKQLAEAVSVHQPTIAYWESGQREPSLDNLVDLAEYFGVTVGYLIGVEKE
jgi:transcriptional regulator with XRE-family HTH domain